MIPEERRQFLLQRLEKKHTLSISELSKTLGVSSMTIRRDIKELERLGQVVAVSGGVRLTSRILKEPPYTSKLRTEIGYKRAIARESLKFVSEDQALFLDAGTTCFQIAQLLAGRTNLAVVTNDFSTAAVLMDHPAIELFHTGGRVDHANRSAVGMAAAAFIDTMNFDVAFISSSSWDVKHGLTTPDQAKVLAKRKAMAAASLNVLVGDSTKFGRFGKFKIADLKSFDYVITDNRLADKDAEEIHDLGVKLILVESETAPKAG